MPRQVPRALVGTRLELLLYCTQHSISQKDITMKRHALPVLILLLVALVPVVPARAQESVYPLPADLYILTSENRLIEINAASGGQAVLVSEEQLVADFAIAPDGAWLIYRTLYSGMVIVTQIDDSSGFVLEFFESTPPVSGQPVTIDWSPDAGAAAYIMPDGVRIAEFGAAEYGGALFTLVQGPWVELFWTGPETLIALDEAGAATRISGRDGQFEIEAAPEGESQRPGPGVAASLTPEGVQLADGTLVPATAGTLAFRWGPLPPPAVADPDLPAALTFLAPDAAGVGQVWYLAGDGAPARALTAGSDPVITYALAPGGDRLAFIAGQRLFVAGADGSAPQAVATLTLDFITPSVAWSPDGAQLAYVDMDGLWLVPADGSAPPRLLVAHDRSGEPGSVRVYTSPRWSPDGARLLVDVGLYEGGVPGVVDAATGIVTELTGVFGGASRWTGDGRVLAWSAFWGYSTPGLYLVDPATPDAAPVTLLSSQFPVLDVIPGPAGGWLVLVASTADMGPQFVRVLRAETLDGPYTPLYDEGAGGFAEQARMVAPGGEWAVHVAGLRGLFWDEMGHPAGELVVINLQTGETVRVPADGPVRAARWVR